MNNRPTPETIAEGRRLIAKLPQGCDVGDYADIFEDALTHASKLERERDAARERVAELEKERHLFAERDKLCQKMIEECKQCSTDSENAMRAELATIAAENIRLREALSKISMLRLMSMNRDIAHHALAIAEDTLSTIEPKPQP